MLVFALGCSLDGGPEVVEALQGGVGYWPADSRAAVQGAIDTELDAVQLDVGLTDDRVPVLAPSPWIAPERCARADGSPLASAVLLHATALADLDGYRCGGLPDPDYPDAVVVAEPILTLDALIELLHTGPNLKVHLAIQQDWPLTAPPDGFAAAVLDRWFAADLPNELTISSPDPAVLAAFDAYARAQDTDLTVIRAWPAPGASDAGNLVQIDADRAASGLDYVTLVEEASADGLQLDADLADPMLLRAARRQGVPVWLVVGDGPAAMSRWTQSPASALIAAYPGDAP